MTLATRLLGTAAGLGLDRFLAEPPDENHPVAQFGRGMQELESRLWADEVAPGILYTAVGLGVAAAVGARVPLPVAVAVSCSGRALGETAERIGDALDEDDIGQARALLPSLVSRDVTLLDEAGVARAVVESVAENFVDAVVAPAFWGVVGGSPMVLVHRAADTMDSMVGYRNDRYRRFGLASARTDDVLAWLPARLAALAVAGARPRFTREVLRAAFVDRAESTSPNAGVSEAAFAAALGVSLGGATVYPDGERHRAVVGTGPAPGRADIGRAADLLRDATGVVALTCATAGGLIRRGPLR